MPHDTRPKQCQDYSIVYQVCTRSLIKNFSSICATLMETIRGDKEEFKWITREAKSFDMLKNKFNKQPISALPD